MAAGVLPEPGTKAGPCEPADCLHIDCAQTRRDALTTCKFCGEPIGYGRAFFRANGSLLAHRNCLEDAVEREPGSANVALFCGEA